MRGWKVSYGHTQTSHPNSWLVTSFWEMNSLEATIYLLQNDKKFGRKDRDLEQLLPTILGSGTVQRSVVLSDWVAGLNPNSFICFGIYKLLSFGTANIIQVFHLFPFNCSASCIFVPSAMYSVFFWEERLEAPCNPNFHRSTQFRASLMYNKMLGLWVFSILEDEVSIPERFLW